MVQLPIPCTTTRATSYTARVMICSSCSLSPKPCSLVSFTLPVSLLNRSSSKPVTNGRCGVVWRLDRTDWEGTTRFGEGGLWMDVAIKLFKLKCIYTYRFVIHAKLRVMLPFEHNSSIYFEQNVNPVTWKSISCSTNSERFQKGLVRKRGKILHPATHLYCALALCDPGTRINRFSTITILITHDPWQPGQREW